MTMLRRTATWGLEGITNLLVKIIADTLVLLPPSFCIRIVAKLKQIPSADFIQGNTEVSRQLKIEAMNGQKYFLVDVISHILRYLKEEFLVQHLRRNCHSVRALDLDWVITVPAIWKVRGKQLMREAGYKAGLCSEQPFRRLTITSCQSPSIPLEPHPDRLSLALEPESASLYCHEMLRRGLVAPFCENPSGSYKPHSYLLVDVGGGTVDISAHTVLSYNKCGSPVVEELHPPVGNDSGGTRVNHEFIRFLEKMFGDFGFSRFVGTTDIEVNIRNRCELNHLVNVVFEEQKQIFGRLPKDRRKEAVVRLPTSMLDIYKEDLLESIKTLGSSRVKLVRQNLRISVELMEEFFQPVVTGILSCIHSIVDALRSYMDVIYLVGGFGGSPYLYWQILEEFGISYKCIVPPNPEFSVVEGSVLFRADPSTIHLRRADATYGKAVIRPFDYKIHDKRHRFFDDSNTPYCDNLFKTIVEIGEVISPTHVYTCTSIPSHHSQRNMCIEIFSSPCRAADVWYISGNEHSSQIEKIGELVIEIDEKPQSERSWSAFQKEIDFTFDFSHTEIQVMAYERSSRKQVKSVIDFLSK